MEAVKTYINSGNVVFSDNKYTKSELPGIIQQAILEDFQMDIKVLVRSFVEFEYMLTCCQYRGEIMKV